MSSEEVEIVSTGDAFKKLDCEWKQKYGWQPEKEMDAHEKDTSSKEHLKLESSQ